MFKRKAKLVLMYAVLSKIEMEILMLTNTDSEFIYIHKGDVLPDKIHVCEKEMWVIVEDSAYEESLINAIISRMGLKSKHVITTKCTAIIKGALACLDGVLTSEITNLYECKLLKRRLNYIRSSYKNDISISEDSLTYSNYTASNLIDIGNIAIDITNIISVIICKTFDVHTLYHLEYIMDEEGIFSSSQLASADTICKLLIDLEYINDYIKYRLDKMKEE